MLSIRLLVWDDWNIAHIARHQISREEVEQACQSDHLSFESYKNRLVLIGPTSAGRMLAVILEPVTDDDVYYVVTARSADRKERRIYRERRGGEIK